MSMRSDCGSERPTDGFDGAPGSAQKIAKTTPCKVGSGCGFLSGEIRLPVAEVTRRRCDTADSVERIRIHHHGPRQPQAARLADRPTLGVLDQFEIDIVGEPEDAPDDLCGREPDGV